MHPVRRRFEKVYLQGAFMYILIVKKIVFVYHKEPLH